MPRKRGNTPSSPVFGPHMQQLPMIDDSSVTSQKNLVVLKKLTEEISPNKVNSFNLPKSLITDVISPKKSAPIYSEKNGYIIRFNDQSPEKLSVLCTICSKNCLYEDLNRCSICPKFYHRRCRMTALSLKRVHKHEFACPMHFAYSKNVDNSPHSPKRLSRLLNLEHPASGLTKGRQCIASRFRKSFLRLYRRKLAVSQMRQRKMQCLIPPEVKDLYEFPQYKIIDAKSSGSIAPIDTIYNRQVNLICQADKKTLSWRGRKSMVKSNETDLFLEAVMKLQGEEVTETSKEVSIMGDGTTTARSQTLSENKPHEDTVTENIQVNGHDESAIDISRVENSTNLDSDIDVSSLDKRLLRMLALDQLRVLCPELFHPMKSEEDASPIVKCFDAPDQCHQTEPEAGELKSESNYYAILTPISYKGEPIKMEYNQLRIGTGEDCHVVVSDTDNNQDSSKQSCRFVSSHHATVFKDKYSNEFELLNYGMVGTVVDGVLYSPNVDLKRSNSQNTKYKKIDRKSNSKADDCDQSVVHPRKKQRMAALLDEDRTVCSCKCQDNLSNMTYANTSLNVSALLSSGSIIHIGCVKLKFDICSSEGKD